MYLKPEEIKIKFPGAVIESGARSDLDKLTSIIVKSRTPDMAGKNEIDHREVSRLLREIHSEISSLRAENERLKAIVDNDVILKKEGV